MLTTIVIGHIGQDAKINHVNNVAAVNFSVAHTESFKDKNGVKQDRTIWVDCTYWEKTNVAPYLKKGTLVYVQGEITPDHYQDKTGKIIAVLRLRVRELKLLSAGSNPGTPAGSTAPAQPAPGAYTAANNNDDLPF